MSAIFHEDRVAWTGICSFSSFWAIPSGVRQNELQNSSVTTRHGKPNHWSYNTNLIKTLTQWLPSVHVARYRLLHVARYRLLRVARYRFLHVARYRLLHVARYRLLHVARYRLLRVARYRLLHVVKYRFLHVARYRLLHVARYRLLHVARYRLVQTAACGEVQTAACGEVQTAACGEVQTAACGEVQTAACGEVQTAACCEVQTAACGEVQTAACGEVQTAAWCIRQKTTLSSTQRESNGDDVWQSPVSFSSSLVSGVAFVPACGTSVQILFCVVFKQCWKLLVYLLNVYPVAQVFFQELFRECITICLTEKSSLDVVFRGRPDLSLS